MSVRPTAQSPLSVEPCEPVFMQTLHSDCSAQQLAQLLPFLSPMSWLVERCPFLLLLSGSSEW